MKHRLFLAIDIPPEVTQPIVSLQQSLERLGQPVIWEPEEKLHLTLNFLGKVDSDQHTSIVRIISATASQTTGFSLKPAFLETLYKKHETSYIYLDVSGQLDLLNELQEKLSDGFSRMLIAQPRKYLPHITVGKLKKMDPVMTKSVLQRFGDMEAPVFPEFFVNHLTLYESLLSRAGSHYQKVDTFRLG